MVALDNAWLFIAAEFFPGAEDVAQGIQCLHRVQSSVQEKKIPKMMICKNFEGN